MDLLPARMVNEFAYCPRLFALEHLNGEWAESADTRRGSRVHKVVDQPDGRSDTDDAPNIRRSVYLGDPEVGVVAKCDLVELDGDTAVPVDYKKGRVPAEGPWLPERVQLGIQAMLLRAHGYVCERGVLYFAGSKTRVDVAIDAALIAETQAAIDGARRMLTQEALPEPLVDSPKCNRCSLVGICLPDETNLLTGKVTSVRPMVPARDDNTVLYVEARGAKIAVRGGEIVVKVQGKEVERVRIRDTASVVLRGSASITTPLLQKLAEAKIPVSLQTYSGWWYGHLQGVGGHNVLGRIAQHRTALSPEASLRIARKIVSGKIRNARVFLKRSRRADDDTLVKMKYHAEKAEGVDDVASLLGHEGNAAALYFGSFARMVKEEKIAELFLANGRNRRPPKDPLNAVLSFAYGNLARSCTEVLQRVGLDPTVGIYHRVRPGRPALSLDLMEEFRTVIAESSVIRAFNTGVLTMDDFLIRRTGVAMKDPGRRRFLKVLEQRWKEQAIHPVFERRMAYRRIVEVQARMLGKAFLGEVEYQTVKIR